MNAKIVTYTGKIFDLLNPTPEMVCIEDIAHSLAHQCRYTGHTREFYSIAQHCVLMVENSDLPGDPLLKLLHDAAETYIGDIARPWKQLLKVYDSFHCQTFRSGYPMVIKEFEQRIQGVIGEALRVNLEYSAEVKEADMRMMATEIRDLMPLMSQPQVWSMDVNSTVKEIIRPWRPKYAERAFLKRYKKLIGV